MDVRIWIWNHYYDGTDNIYLYPTEQTAKQAVFQYVSDEWNEGNMDDEPFTGNHDIDVPAYFNYHDENESSHIYSQKVGGLPAPNDFVFDPPPEGEVIFSPHECLATISAISNTAWKTVADDMGTDRQTARTLMESVMKKLET